jgi:hypothetical protein
MAESNNDLIIKFSGRLDNLLIKHKGKVILNYKGSEVKRDKPAAGYLRNQGKLGVTSSFAKAVYSIPILKGIWHKSYFKKSPRTRYKVAPHQRKRPGKAVSFNKIVAGNNKFSGAEHPTVNNIIVPPSDYFFDMTQAILHNKGIDISIPPSQDFFTELESGATINVAAVICAYNPIRKVIKRYELFPKSYTACDFNYAESTEINFSFESKEEEEILKYRNLLLYYSVICTDKMERIIRWSGTQQLQFLIKARKEGLK